MDFDEQDLTCRKYEVNQNWMLTIAYYRGTLDEYKDHPIVKNLVEQSGNCDYIIAPIADNRMFQIINSFIGGEITDEQCNLTDKYAAKRITRIVSAISYAGSVTSH